MVRRTSKLLSLETYQPEAFLDHLKTATEASSDTKLAGKLDVSGAEISRMRNRLRPITAKVLINAHELTGESIRELRNRMGDLEPGFFEPGLRFSAGSDEKSC